MENIPERKSDNLAIGSVADLGTSILSEVPAPSVNADDMAATIAADSIPTKGDDNKPDKPKRGRPKGSTSAKSRVRQPKTDPFEAPAVATVGMIVGMCRAMFDGEEWATSESENEFMVNAWRSYYEANEITDFPPGIALTLAMGSYFAVRMTKPKTSSKLKKVGGFFVGLFKRKK